MTTPTEREALIARLRVGYTLHQNDTPDLDAADELMNLAADMLAADEKENQILRVEVELYRNGCDKREASIARLQAELADLKAIADSDDGAGGDGMRLVLRNRELEAVLDGIRKQAPTAYINAKVLQSVSGNHDMAVRLSCVRNDFTKVDVPLYLAAGAQQVAQITEVAIDEFLEDYELVGESEDGRDACYRPNETELAVIKDAIIGLLSSMPQPQQVTADVCLSKTQESDAQASLCITDEQQVAVPQAVLLAISRAGFTLLKNQFGYELRKLGPVIAYAAPQPPQAERQEGAEMLAWIKDGESVMADFEKASLGISAAFLVGRWWGGRPQATQVERVPMTEEEARIALGLERLPPLSVMVDVRKIEAAHGIGDKP